jgi:CRP/FNR family transcriptional regulator, cyclic AMP receptor protein
MEPSAFREHPFVRTLSDSQLDRLLPCAREVRYGEDAFIFREGGDADTLYLLRAGYVALEQHVPGKGSVKVESLCAGDILGLSWLFPASRWMLDARCLSPVQAFALGADCVHERMKEDPALGLELLTQIVHTLYQRLVRVRLQRLDVYKAEG